MKITLEDIAKSFGTEINKLPAECLEIYHKKNWEYELITGNERDNLICELMAFLETDKQRVGAEYRFQEWDIGWAENLNKFRQSRNIEDLTPKFLRPNQIVRWQQQFIRPMNPTFEKDFVSMFLTWCFKMFFAEPTTIYEFGCGSGFNSILLNNIFPSVPLVATDFSPAAVQLIQELSKDFPQLSGSLFDMKIPDFSLKLAPDSLVFTSGAIEQLAGQFHAFLLYLFLNRPRICLHIEPTVELYDPSNIVDMTAISFHKKRGYTTGLLPTLRQLAQQGIIEIIACKRTGFGSLRMEGWNYYAWRLNERI